MIIKPGAHVAIYGFFALVLLTVVSCGESPHAVKVAPKPPPTTSPQQASLPGTPIPTPQVSQLSPVIDQLTQQVLLNIREHGWNASAMDHGQTTGGLYINWKMDDPSQTNALKTGSDGETSGSHDPQVELYYLNALAEYKTLHPQDQSFNGDIQKALPYIRADFANYNVPKGWIYFYLLRDGSLLHDDQLVNEAHLAATNFYTHWYDPNAGLVYNRAHSPGVYNTEHALNCAAALIDAGKRWNEPTWVTAGEEGIDHVISVALDPQTHLFYNNVNVLADGSQQVLNHQAKPSTQGNGVEALLTAYNLTHNQHYLDVAGQVLQSMFSSRLWDDVNGGLFFALDLDTNVLEQSYKETRAQTLSLIALHRYNLLMHQLGQPQIQMEKETKLIDVLSHNFYQSTYHGFFYRMTPTFQVYRSHAGTGIGYEDYFTTEAMGTALDALQQTEFASLSI
ncbi:hypothetical protein KTT_24760 [Tengunoibacter tsumagoiensis]|uniref:D-glucuronyl C5-epimerase C-terminal domain-containing protein n=2 Tax=Tengunoibacter tsumagoiensis TaxID=2014871 RepID=A0A402A0D5_9CHLR|nr:hypothetical protein KTT_24760 [Tengunoibacter tsumagoiensis]